MWHAGTGNSSSILRTSKTLSRNRKENISMFSCCFFSAYLLEEFTRQGRERTLNIDTSTDVLGLTCEKQLGVLGQHWGPLDDLKTVMEEYKNGNQTHD